MSEAATRRLIIEFVSDVSNLKKGFSEAEGFTGKFSAGVKGIAKVAGTVLSVGAAADVMKVSLEAAVTDEASVSALATQMDALKIPKENQKSVEDFIQKLSLTKGVADDELRPAFAQLLRSTGSTTKAMEQLGLAQDIAAGKGISVAAAANILAMATVGNLKPLRTLGVVLDDASKYGAGTEGIFKKLGIVFAGAGDAAAETGEGKLRKMRVGFDEIKEQLGYALLPIMEKLVDWITKSLIPAIEIAVAWCKENFPKAIKAIQDAWDTLWPYIDNVVQVFKGIFETIQGVVNAFIDIFKGHWGKLWDDVLQIFKGLGDIIVGAVGALWEQLKLLAETAGKALLNAWLSGMQSVWDNIVYPWLVGVPLLILETLKDANIWLLQKGKDLLLGLVHGLEDAWSDVFTWFFNLPGLLWDAVKDAANWLVDFGRNLVKGIVRGIKEAPDAIRDALISLVPGGGGTVDKILKYIGIPAFAEGGPVLGPKGAPQLAVVHGGEYVLSNAMLAGGRTATGPTINYYVTVNAGLGTDPRALEDAVVSGISNWRGRNGPAPWMA